MVRSQISSTTTLLPWTALRVLKGMPTLTIPSLLGVIIVPEPNIFMMRLDHNFLSHSALEIPLLKVILYQGHSTHSTRVLRPHPQVSCHVHSIFNTDTPPPTAKKAQSHRLLQARHKTKSLRLTRLQNLKIQRMTL